MRRASSTTKMSCRRHIPWFVVLFSLLLAAPAVFAELPKVAFTVDDVHETKKGAVSLEWAGEEEGLVYQLQSGRSEDFDDPLRRYEGRDTASFLSGLEDGRYFFRVRARRADASTWGPWASPVRVDSNHHAMDLALTLCVVGAFLFLCIAVFIVINSRSLSRFERYDD